METAIMGVSLTVRKRKKRKHALREESSEKNEKFE